MRKKEEYEEVKKTWKEEEKEQDVNMQRGKCRRLEGREGRKGGEGDRGG